MYKRYFAALFLFLIDFIYIFAIMAKNENPYLKSLRCAGRPVVFDTPRDLKIKALEYFNFCDNDDTWNQQNWVGKDGKEVVKNMKTPYTLSGFYAFTGLNNDTFDAIKSRYKITEGKTEDERLNDINFYVVGARISTIISANQIEGAASGMYNPHIISRLQGLTEKRDITSDGQKINVLTGVKVELPEGTNLEQIEDAEIVEEPTLTIKKNIA